MKLKIGLLFALCRRRKDAAPSGAGPLVRFLQDESGTYIVWMAMVLPIMLGMVGLGTEAAVWLYKHRTVQSAAVNAAYSAANAYAVNSSTNIVTQGKAV